MRRPALARWRTDNRITFIRDRKPLTDDRIWKEQAVCDQYILQYTFNPVFEANKGPKGTSL